jgi:hypothetical protein
MPKLRSVPIAVALSTRSGDAAQGCVPGDLVAMPDGFRGAASRDRRVAAGVEHVCPPGYGLGPWAHCRDTPYHGRPQMVAGDKPLRVAANRESRPVPGDLDCGLPM